MPKLALSWRMACGVGVWVLALLYLHYGLDRTSVWLVPIFGVSFLAYVWLYQGTDWSFKQLFVVSIIIRLSLFFGKPSLSDDYFRFVWDGQLWAAGINPYEFTPEELIQSLPSDMGDLYVQLNSQTYHTTYPPVSQYVFSIPAFLGLKDTFWSMTALRFVLLCFEIGVIVLLFCMTKSAKKVLLYAFNPLAVLELVGNLHFEGVVIFFMLLAWYLYDRKRWVGGALAWALGILAKLTPLMFLPVLIKKLGMKRALWSYMIIAVIMVMLSLPFLKFDFLLGMGDGLDLFFRKFEFNAGIFFLIRAIGFWVKGHDIVQTAGPLLSVFAFLLIMAYTFMRVDQKTSWASVFTIILFIQLILATTVHPWYVIPLVAFSCFTGYGFPLLWSGLIFLSYLGYSQEGYEHPMFWIGIEYLAVGSVAAFELIKNKPLLKNV